MVSHVTEASPLPLLMHGRNDGVVDVAHSRRFFDRLDDAGVNAIGYALHDLPHIWADALADTESERVAMDWLAAEPSHVQPMYQATHVGEGQSPARLMEDLPPAGPVAIQRFLERPVECRSSVVDADSQIRLRHRNRDSKIAAAISVGSPRVHAGTALPIPGT